MAGWRIAAASVTGTSHLTVGAGCQDSHAVVVVSAAEGDTLVAAVADGAGTARAGEIGASIAVQAICEQATEWLRSGRTCEDIDEDCAHTWLDGVREQIADRAAEAEADMREYACTLLAAVIGERYVAFMQIGDGAIVCRDREPGWSWVFWPQHGPYVNTTFFATDDTAHEAMAFSRGPTCVTELAMFSDGLENLALHSPTRSAHDPFFNAVFKPLRASEATGLDAELCGFLSAYLSSPVVAQRTNDDVTLVLASRRTSSIDPTDGPEDHGATD